jgi:ABC-2 type transport system ATP-binding protein
MIQQVCRDREEAYAIAQGMDSRVTVRKTNLEDVFIKLAGGRIE